MRRTIPLWIMMALAAGPAQGSGGIAVEPGQWTITTSTEMSMMPEPQVQTYTECFEEAEFHPEDFHSKQETACEVSAAVIEGGTARWSFTCGSGEAAMRGQWEVNSDGDTLTGTGTMTGDFSGEAMKVTVRWKGEREGDCD